MSGKEQLIEKEQKNMTNSWHIDKLHRYMNGSFVVVLLRNYNGHTKYITPLI